MSNSSYKNCRYFTMLEIIFQVFSGHECDSRIDFKGYHVNKSLHRAYIILLLITIISTSGVHKVSWTF